MITYPNVCTLLAKYNCTHANMLISQTTSVKNLEEENMFDGGRNRIVIFLALCFLNQHTVLDSTADYPSAYRFKVDLLLNSAFSTQNKTIGEASYYWEEQK